jgi:serine/threonine-protein kinase
MTRAHACPSASDLQRLTLGQLPEQEADRLGRHVLACPSCAESLSALQTADPLVALLHEAGAGAGPSVPPAGVLVERLLRAVPELADRAAPACPTTVPADPAPVSDHGLVPLLRRRLRFLLVVFALYFGVILLLHICYYLGSFPGRIDFWASAVTFAACLGLVAVLSGCPRLTLRQLRLVEFLLFVVFGVRMVLRGYVLLWQGAFIDRIHTALAAGEVLNAQDLLTGLAYRLTAASAMFVVAYGVIVPNTWRRCALVVAAFTLLPVLMWVLGCVSRELPARDWFSFQTVIAFLVVILTAVLSVYGAYRIESSRQAAAEARRLGPYTLVRKLGSGGMGEVYLAEHRLLKRPCAVKLIRPDKAADPRLLQRFEREVQATAGLTHPNAVQVFDYGHAPDGTFYYVMEYLPGLTLQELVEQHGPLPPGRAVYLLRQVCGALREAHAAGLIHRDVKPGKVIVCERGGTPDVAKLLDFGLVRDVGGGGAELTGDGVVTGTPAYMSPEQAGGGAVDARADIYAVGGLAYFLLTGRPPFADRSALKVVAAHLYESPAPPSRQRPEVPADLEAVVLRCLAKAPADRFPDVASLDAALGACASAGQWSPAEAAAWWRSRAVDNPAAVIGDDHSLIRGVAFPARSRRSGQ